MRIWEECDGHLHVTPLPSLTKVWRIVEDQYRSSTRNLVDTLSEHDILEKMLERHKPEIVYYGDEDAFKGLHYLLFIPFRYPPLDYCVFR